MTVTPTTNSNGKAGVYANDSCGYPVQAAVEWKVCIPNAATLGQSCTMALWSYGSSVKTGGKSSVDASAPFGNIQVNSGYRYFIAGHWVLVDQDGHVVKNPVDGGSQGPDHR